MLVTTEIQVQHRQMKVLERVLENNPQLLLGKSTANTAALINQAGVTTSNEILEYDSVIKSMSARLTALMKRNLDAVKESGVITGINYRFDKMHDSILIRFTVATPIPYST